MDRHDDPRHARQRVVANHPVRQIAADRLQVVVAEEQRGHPPNRRDGLGDQRHGGGMTGDAGRTAPPAPLSANGEGELVWYSLLFRHRQTQNSA